MKKFLLCAALFAAMGSLFAVELPAAGWKIHTIQGKFKYQKDKYPLLISCQQPTERDGKMGVWGRLYRKEMLEVGKKYEIKVTYKMTNAKKPVIAVWVRGGAAFNMFGRNVNVSKTLSRQFTAAKAETMIYINLQEGTADLEVASVEISPVE